MAKGITHWWSRGRVIPTNGWLGAGDCSPAPSLRTYHQSSLLGPSRAYRWFARVLHGVFQAIVAYIVAPPGPIGIMSR